MSFLEVDHIVPRSSGGPNDSLNLATACVECNRGKAALHLPEAELRFLLAEIADEEGESSEHHMLAARAAAGRRSVSSLFYRMATAGR